MIFFVVVPAAQGIVFHSSRARNDGARREKDAETCSLSDYPINSGDCIIPSMDGVQYIEGVRHHTYGFPGPGAQSNATRPEHVRTVMLGMYVPRSDYGLDGLIDEGI